MKKNILSLLLVFITVSVVYAQSFSTSGITEIKSKATVNASKSVKGVFFITHSLDQSIVSPGSVSCNAGGLHTDNSYFRLFDLVADFGINEAIQISSVDFGIEQASSNAGDQPVTVNVYTLSGAFVMANLTLINTMQATVVDQVQSILNVPINAIIPQGAQLVIEVFTPDGQGVGNSFFIGSNNLGETGPSYIMAVGCGISEPVPTAAIGFPNNQYVINVNADPVAPEVPLKSWAIILSFFLFSAFVVFRVKR